MQNRKKMIALNLYTKLINYKYIKQTTFIMITVWLSTAIYLNIMLCVNANQIQGIIQMIMAVLLMILWDGKGLKSNEARDICKIMNDNKQYPSWQI